MSNFRIIGTCPRCNYETGETVSHTQILNSTRIEMHCDGCDNRFAQGVKEEWKKQAAEMNAPAPGSMAMVPPGKTLMDIAEKGLKYDAGKQLAGTLYEYFPNALSAVADVATFGAHKYKRSSWLNVENNLERYTDALHRHMLAEARGEKVDEDSGLPHRAHAAWNLLAILELMLRSQMSGPTIRPKTAGFVYHYSHVLGFAGDCTKCGASTGETLQNVCPVAETKDIKPR